MLCACSETTPASSQRNYDGEKILPQAQQKYVELQSPQLLNSSTQTANTSTQTSAAEEAGVINPFSDKPYEIAEKLLASLDEEALAAIVREVIAKHPIMSSLGLRSPSLLGVPHYCNHRGKGLPKDGPGFGSIAVMKATDVPPAILQFSTGIYYAAEEESEIEIEVLRIGDSSGSCSVSYKTLDMSAIAGVKYIAMSGTLEFKPGEIKKVLKAMLINDDMWDTTLDFAIVMSNPSEGTSISETLQMCRIKILDNDTFPSNRFSELALQGRFIEIPRLSQLHEYCKMNLKFAPIRRGTRIWLLFDFMENLMIVWDLLLQLYVVDVCLGRDGDRTQKTIELAFVGLMHLAPEILALMMDHVRVSLRLGGKCRVILQGNIMRKFLNYDDSVRATILESDLIMSINSDCPSVVKDGYFTCLALIKDISLLVLLFVYQLTVTLLSGEIEENPVTVAFVIVPTFVLPLLMYSFFQRRERATTMALLRRDLARNRLGTVVEMIVRNVRLILDMSQRNAVINDCMDSVVKFNNSQVVVDELHSFNKAFAPVITDFFVAVFIVFGGHFVLDGRISIGQFLTNLAVYVQMCNCWNNVYEQLLTINSALPAVEQVSRYLNLPIDLHKRREMGNAARATNHEERKIARSKLSALKEKGGDCAMYAIDTVPLKLINLGFYYRAMNYDMTVQGSLAEEANGQTTKQGSQAKSGKAREAKEMTYYSSLETKNLEMSWNLSIPQGSILAIIGKHGDGKGTLLRILGGVFLPASGIYFVPPQLRVSFCGSTPLFFRQSLFDNLCFGLSAQDKKSPEQPARVKSICRRFQVSEQLLEHISSPLARDWAQLLSTSQLRKLHLARVFVANAEVIVLERPTAGFDLKTTTSILDLMKEHVRCKGIEASSSQPHLRRPRTLIFSTDRPEACSVADLIYLIKRDRVRQVEHEHITDEMLYEEWVA